MVGTGVGARHGLLIKGGAVLENMHSLDVIIFDKTGTLTNKKVVLGSQHSFLSDDDQILHGIPSRVSNKNVLLWLAACAESQSEHPLALAVLNAAKSVWGDDFTQSDEGVRIENYRIVPGSGVECYMKKDHWGMWIIRVGTREWTKSGNSVSLDSSNDTTGDEEAVDLRLRGHVVVYVSALRLDSVARSGQVIGILSVLDPIDGDARSAVLALKKLGIDVWLCTGDHEITARAVASKVGIDDGNVCAGISPEGKADLVTRLQKTGRAEKSGASSTRRRVAMVGDGINDAVALARADVGIAIGAGTEVAVEAADVVLVKSSLHDVVVGLHLSRIVFHRILSNFFWAMSYNVLAIPFAAGLFFPLTNFRIPPEFAGAMMAFSSVSVVTNSLLLRRYRRPEILEDGNLDEGESFWWKIWMRMLTLPLRREGTVDTTGEDVLPLKQLNMV